MHIILICRHSHGQVSFPASLIEGRHAPERRYEIVDHHVTLEGHLDIILHHDADELLAMPGKMYGMPTPAEMDELAEGARQAAMVQEDAPTKKKASGG